MKTIFNYTDYRKYLADIIMERKSMNRHFSFRFMSQRLDLKSSAFMHRVIHGKKRLPETIVPKIAELFKLNNDEKDYLIMLVKFNHCIDAAEREELFGKLERIAKKKKARQVPPEQYKVFDEWFYVAIRELLRIISFKNDFHSLATSLHPKIKNKEARAAIQTLKKIGLIAQDENGFYHPLDHQITTGDVWESELIKNLQIQFADMGKNAILTVPKEKRDISNLTFCASEATMRKVGAEIAALRKKILTFSDSDSNADTLYQCNMQLFPISQKNKGAGK
jgi:uncharacterized protein (TIGR02147 family)